MKNAANYFSQKTDKPLLGTLCLYPETIRNINAMEYLAEQLKATSIDGFMLNTAENQIREFKKRGMSGQNRDFAPAIEVNRIAMCANNEDYGLKLRFDWLKE